MMRRIILACLILAGAAAGGIFPGALVAFYVAADGPWSGSIGEVFCLVANLILGVGGALVGGSLGQVIRPETKWSSIFLSSAVAGLMAGVAGYFWLEWALRHADPPL